MHRCGPAGTGPKVPSSRDLSSISRRRCGGQREPEPAASAGVAVDIDEAAVPFHCSAYDGQSQPGARETFTAGHPDEGIEHVRPLFRWNTDAAVGDLDPV